MIATSILDKPYTLSAEQVEFYKTNKYIKLKEVLDEQTLAHFNTVISNKVDELNNVEIPLEERSTYGKAFLQLFNLWVQDAIIKELVFSKRMAKIAYPIWLYVAVSGVIVYLMISPYYAH